MAFAAVALGRIAGVCRQDYPSASPIQPPPEADLREFTAIIERDRDTGLYVGYVPGFPGGHSQGATLDELNSNLAEVLAMLLEDGEPLIDGDFVGTQRITVA